MNNITHKFENNVQDLAEIVAGFHQLWNIQTLICQEMCESGVGLDHKLLISDLRTDLNL